MTSFEILPGILINPDDVAESTFGHKTQSPGGILVVTWKTGAKTVYETATEQDAKKAHLRLAVA